MERLDFVAKEIAQGYLAYGPSPSLPVDVCLYNGATLNGSFVDLGARVQAALHERGVSLRSLTLSRAPFPVGDQYSVDVAWFLQKHATVSET